MTDTRKQHKGSKTSTSKQTRDDKLKQPPYWGGWKQPVPSAPQPEPKGEEKK